MKIKLVIIICFICTCKMARAQGKIGYVNGDKVFAAMPETKLADSTLQLFEEKAVKSYTEKETVFNNEYAKFIKDSAAMASSVRKTKYQEIKEKANKLAAENDNLRISIANEKQKSQLALINKMELYIKEHATKNGFAHIIYDSNAIVLNNADDITEDVIKKITQK